MLKCLQRSCDFPVTVQDEDAHICLPYLEANVAAGAKGREYTCKQVKIIVFCRDLDWLRKWRESLANEKAKQCVPFTDNLSDSF